MLLPPTAAFANTGLSLSVGIPLLDSLHNLVWFKRSCFPACSNEMRLLSSVPNRAAMITYAFFPPKVCGDGW